MGIVKGNKIEAIEVPKIGEVIPFEKSAFEFRSENLSSLVGKDLQGDLVESGLRLKGMAITPDLTRNVGVQYTHLSLAKREANPRVLTPLRVGATVAMVGLITAVVKNPEWISWAKDLIKTFGSLISLSFLPTLGMAHTGKGGFLNWLRSLWPWRKKELKALPAPENTPSPSDLSGYRDFAQATIDLPTQEQTMENVRRALREGGKMKASPKFGVRYFEIIVDLNTGTVLDRNSVNAKDQGLTAGNLRYQLGGREAGAVAAQLTVSRLQNEIAQNQASISMEGPGWTSLTFTLDDLFQGKINLPDWEVVRLRKMLQREGLMPENRGVIQGLIDLDEVK